ncbi:MAG: hypothetical protein MZV64_21675 [Ignavibacteriales bacterium]|nr:hypothetical protein [Ignavibacteriales bacterium]
MLPLSSLPSPHQTLHRLGAILRHGDEYQLCHGGMARRGELRQRPPQPDSGLFRGWTVPQATCRLKALTAANTWSADLINTKCHVLQWGAGPVRS